MSLNAASNGPAEPMRTLIEDQFQSTLKSAEHLARTIPRHDYVNADPRGSTFVGAETCKPCHPNTFTKWADAPSTPAPSRPS